MSGLGRLIDDNAFAQLKPKQYETISKLMENPDVAKVARGLNDTVKNWCDYGLFGRNKPLEWNTVYVRDRGIYETFQNKPRGWNEFNYSLSDVMPKIKIIAPDRKEMVLWADFLNREVGLKRLEKPENSETVLFGGGSYNGVFQYQTGNREYPIEVEITYTEIETKPVYGAVSAADEHTRDIAAKRLQTLIEFYSQLDFDSNPSIQNREMQTAVRQGDIRFFTFNGEEMHVVAVATYLDAVFRIGQKLAWNMNSIYILKNGGDKDAVRVRPDDPVKPEARIKVEKTPSVIGSDGQKVIPNNTLPTQYDQVRTDRGIQGVSAGLDLKRTEPEVLENAHRRGMDIIKWIYLAKRGKKLDSHIRPMFARMIAEPGNRSQQRNVGEKLHRFLTDLGMTPQPALKADLLGNWDELRQNNTTVNTAFDLVEKLIQERYMKPEIVIHIPDQTGIWNSITSVAKKLKISILNGRFNINPDNLDEDESIIQFVADSTEYAKIDVFLKILRKNLGKDVKVELVQNEPDKSGGSDDNLE
jgi:hypothetical protein